ncbi:hypothetical protein F511_13322 [Dorcoceras hygrometricum]|uniref:Uncharacterized protein n=1 Tax=Dorcoceras hygrometricum TaxID=472368 RepID=A0A2Z7DCQ2_9LAMI|nr:hypothetical protein F511_13322 [Dorcoceras hygrometricum]
MSHARAVAHVPHVRWGTAACAWQALEGGDTVCDTRTWGQATYCGVCARCAHISRRNACTMGAQRPPQRVRDACITGAQYASGARRLPAVVAWRPHGGTSLEMFFLFIENSSFDANLLKFTYDRFDPEALIQLLAQRWTGSRP